MKIAIIGSRNIKDIIIDEFVPPGITEIVSGGARGIDQLSKDYALKNNIKYTEFLPEYNLYSRVAPLKRNIQIVDYSDTVIAIWDGKSNGTRHVIEYCKQNNKTCVVITV